MDLFETFDRSSLNAKYADRAKEGAAATTKLVKAREALTGDARTAIDELYEVAKGKHEAFKGLAATATDAEKAAAKTAAEASKDALTSFLRGETAHKVGETSVQLSDDLGKELRDAYIDAEAAVSRVSKAQKGVFGMALTQKEGFSKALTENRSKMKFWKDGLEPMQRVRSFAHGSAVVGSVIGMGDAILRSKDSEGEDRSAMTRLAEFVVSGGLGTVALIGGPAAAR